MLPFDTYIVSKTSSIYSTSHRIRSEDLHLSADLLIKEAALGASRDVVSRSRADAVQYF